MSEPLAYWTTEGHDERVHSGGHAWLVVYSYEEDAAVIACHCGATRNAADLKGLIEALQASQRELNFIRIGGEDYYAHQKVVDLVHNLQQEVRFLNALKAAGVDNWDGYSYAFELMEED